MKVYRGTSAEARGYLERDHSGADRYYLGETGGIADILTVTAEGIVASVCVDGQGYEQWVKGLTVEGAAKGRIRGNPKAHVGVAGAGGGDGDGPANTLRGAAAGEPRLPIRFCEVLVNGPKSWSLAAVLRPEIRIAYDDAQDRVVEELARYLQQNVTTKVGKRGQQRSLHVDELSVVAVKHYTSRAGDPHRHIHLQVNARVLVDGVWRGLDSQALLRMSRAINGIGHRTVLADPGFRRSVAEAGFTLRDDGEITELATAVPAMSKRSAQISRQIGRFERDWRKEHPDQEPTRLDQRAWESKAWAAGRPKKTQAHAGVPGEVVERGWLTELRELGIDVDRIRVQPAVAGSGVPIGDVDPDEVAGRAVAVVAAGARGRSTWNVHDLRGAVEEVIANRHLVGEPRTVTVFAEDAAARARNKCTSVLDNPDVPGHVRHLTSTPVMEMEEDIKGRLGVRAAQPHQPGDPAAIRRAQELSGRTLLPGQAAAVSALTGTGQLVVIEGPAGAAKTGALATARQVLEARGAGNSGRMVIVAPSKKAAIVAGQETGADAHTAQSLAYAHGWRWDKDGVWYQLGVGEVDPDLGGVYRGAPDWAQLGEFDVLVVDEAGMLSQDVAQAMLHIADRGGARFVMVGDRRQLDAVGRGGVMGMALEWGPTFVEMDSVYRFRNPDGTLDRAYADLSLRIRAGTDPERVFDTLVETGRVVLHGTQHEMTEAVAEETAERHMAGVRQSVSTATNEAAEAVNELVRARLVAAGLVDNEQTAHGMDGLRMGRGDLVTTRRNDRDTDVANRVVWRVTDVNRFGTVSLTNARRPSQRTSVPARYVRESVHLAYASTAHAVQGETSQVGAYLMSDSEDASSVYVGMTRGQSANQIHIVAPTVDDAREQWVEAMDRDRGDIGLIRAADRARGEADQYAPDSELSFADRLARAMHPELAAEDAPRQVETVAVGDESYGPQQRPRQQGRGHRL